MTTSGAITIAVLSVAFYVCGGLCIFRTKMLVAWGRRSYAKSKLVQGHPLSDMVTISRLHQVCWSIYLAVGARL